MRDAFLADLVSNSPGPELQSGRPAERDRNIDIIRFLYLLKNCTNLTLGSNPATAPEGTAMAVVAEVFEVKPDRAREIWNNKKSLGVW